MWSFVSTSDKTKKNCSKTDALWKFWFKVWLFDCISGSSMANKKEECDDFATCLCMIIGAACLFVGFFIVAGLMMAVMTNSIALPLLNFESLLVAKISKLIKIWFQKLLNCYYNYHNRLGTNPIIFINSNSFFALFNFFCKDWSTGLRWFCFFGTSSISVFCSFSSEFFFGMLGILSTPVSFIKTDRSLHIIKHLTTLDNIFFIESLLEQCIETVHVLI